MSGNEMSRLWDALKGAEKHEGLSAMVNCADLRAALEALSSNPPAAASEVVREALEAARTWLKGDQVGRADQPLHQECMQAVVAQIDNALATLSPTQPEVERCAASPDHADIMETIENASDDWQKNGYTSALAEVRDMANVGRALMEALPKGYSYMNCPSEIVSDLQNERDEALATSTATHNSEALTALQETADALENLLSADPDMPTYQADYDAAEVQLVKARSTLDSAEVK